MPDKALVLYCSRKDAVCRRGLRPRLWAILVVCVCVCVCVCVVSALRINFISHEMLVRTPSAARGTDWRQTQN